MAKIGFGMLLPNCPACGEMKPGIRNAPEDVEIVEAYCKACRRIYVRLSAAMIADSPDHRASANPSKDPNLEHYQKVDVEVPDCPDCGRPTPTKTRTIPDEECSRAPCCTLCGYLYVRLHVIMTETGAVYRIDPRPVESLRERHLARNKKPGGGL